MRGRLERVVRWLRNRQTGPIPRIRRVGSVIKATIRARGPWRSLPESLATALLAPVRVAGRPEPTPAPRIWDAERLGAAQRLVAGRAAVERESARTVTVATLAGPDYRREFAGAVRLIPVRPEDYVATLTRAMADDGGLGALIIRAPRDAAVGPWAYRIGWFAHPDAFLHRDLGGLIRFFHERGLPSILLISASQARDRGAWEDSAQLFDAVVVPDDPSLVEVSTWDLHAASAHVVAPDAATFAVLMACAEGASR